MAYVPVPKDLSKIKPTVMFNLTKRQLFCFGSGAVVGFGNFRLTENAGFLAHHRIIYWYR